MSRRAERGPLLAGIAQVGASDGDTAQVPSAMRSISAINSSQKFGDSKLQSPLPLGQRHHADYIKTPPCYKYATLSVTYFALAAAFAAILTGCALGFPSSAILDLTDSKLNKEYKLDESLSDLFGVSS